MSAETETPAATAAEAPAETPAEKPANTGKEAEEAYNHLMQGKRHLLVKDYPSAVASLADACALLAGKCGDLAPECGDFYLYYGKALLELARAEAGVFEMAPVKTDGEEEDGDDDDEDKDSKEDKEESESKEDSDDASKSGEEEADNDGEEEKSKTEKDENSAEVKKDEKTEDCPGTSNGASGSKNADDGEEVDDDKDEDGEVNNLQLAWEILEMAKIIFQKQVDSGSSNKETKIKLSEVLLKLGEVGIESENWPTAIDDLKACLTLQGEILDKDDRRLAETYYHLAVAHSNNNEYQESIESYEKACSQLLLRIEALEAKRPKEDMINQTLIDSEVKELRELLVEMKERLNDTMTVKDEPAPKDDQDDIVKNGSDSKPASNITHLVRKKPKAEPSEASADSKIEIKADKVDKTEAGSNAEERKRKSEDDEAAAAAALKKAKVES